MDSNWENMAELFRSVTNTRSGPSLKQKILTGVLVYVFFIVLLLLTFVILPNNLWSWFLPASEFLTVVFIILLLFVFFRNPKELELLVTNEKLHAYNGLGLRKGYVDLTWNEILEIRPVDPTVRTDQLKQVDPILGETGKILGNIENEVLNTQENRILCYAVLTPTNIYVVEIESKREKEFTGAIEKFGKYNPRAIFWVEVWKKRGGLFSLK